MRVPPFYRYTRYMRGLAIFICGLIIGAAIFSSLQHHMYTILAIRNEKLTQDNKQLQLNLQQANRTKLRASSIATIQVEYETTATDRSRIIDELTTEEIEAKVRDHLRSMIGKSTSLLKEVPQIFYALVEEPSYRTSNGNTYKVRVKRFLLIQSDLIVTITANEDLRS